MIPAILSCLFVIYLYRTLNAPPADETASAPAGDDDASSRSLEALTERLGELETRLRVIQSDRARRQS